MAANLRKHAHALLRARADLNESLAMSARRAWRANSARSSSGSVPSGSTWRQYLANRASRAAWVWAVRSARRTFDHLAALAIWLRSRAAQESGGGLSLEGGVSFQDVAASAGTFPSPNPHTTW